MATKKSSRPTPTSRTYEHRHCGGVTEISDDDFSRVANPFAFVGGETYCAGCDSDISLEDLYWTDTGESIADFRRRHRAKAPLSLKLTGWLVAPLGGFLIGGGIGWLIMKDFWFGFVGIGCIGLFCAAAFSMPLLSTLVWKIDYRRKK